MSRSVVLLKKETVKFLKGRLFEAAVGSSEAAEMPGFPHRTESRYARQMFSDAKAFVFANDHVEAEFEVMTDAIEKGSVVDGGVEPCESLFYRDSEFFGDSIRYAMFGDGTRTAAETVWLNDGVFGGNF